MNHAFGLIDVDVQFVKNPKASEARQFAEHQRRMDIIRRPFPVIQRARIIPGYIWSGTIVGDHFFGDGEEGGRGRKANRKTTEGDSYGGDYHYGRELDADGDGLYGNYPSVHA